METQTKQSIEEAAEQLLTYKVKGEGDISHIIDKAEVLNAGIQYLVNNKYLTKIKGSYPCEYDVTLEGFEYILMKKEDHVFIREQLACKPLNTLLLN